MRGNDEGAAKPEHVTVRRMGRTGIGYFLENTAEVFTAVALVDRALRNRSGSG